MKKMLSGLLALLMVFSLVGCANQTSNDSNNGDDKEELMMVDITNDNVFDYFDVNVIELWTEDHQFEGLGYYLILKQEYLEKMISEETILTVQLTADYNGSYYNVIEEYQVIEYMISDPFYTGTKDITCIYKPYEQLSESEQAYYDKVSENYSKYQIAGFLVEEKGTDDNGNYLVDFVNFEVVGASGTLHFVQ